jgi:hypothetical protein
MSRVAFKSSLEKFLKNFVIWPYSAFTNAADFRSKKTLKAKVEQILTRLLLNQTFCSVAVRKSFDQKSRNLCIHLSVLYEFLAEFKLFEILCLKHESEGTLDASPSRQLLQHHTNRHTDSTKQSKHLVLKLLFS